MIESLEDVLCYGALLYHDAFTMDTDEGGD
jgi:hypothetical protein